MVRIIAPRTGGNEIPVGQDDHEFREYTAAVHLHNETGAITLVIRFRFSDEERTKIAEGEDLYLGVMTYGGPILPMMMSVGPEEINTVTTPVM